jgi:lipopolysaccharide transport system ATP-binding protein
MSDNILEVNNVGKAYRSYGSEWRRVLTWFGVPFQPRVEHWTLQNVSFSLRPGEAVGIVGQNGAGKSTLLKAITGTLKPSTGEVKHFGRIAAILELGMGFHPDLTGRQNSYHSAGLMGYSQQQIDSVIADIEAFAEIGEYFDQPVRVYSSGMHVRVAFAVATAYRPQLLIVDEALSVGDTYFQHKSIGRIREFVEQGTSLLLVSHDNSAIMSICQRAILLENGQLIADGLPENIINVYSARTADREAVSSENALLVANAKAHSCIRSGSQKAFIIQHRFIGNMQKTAETVLIGEQLTLEVEVEINQPIQELGLGIMLRDRYGLPVFGTNSYLQKQTVSCLEIGQIWCFHVQLDANIGVGHYSLTIAIEDESSTRLDWIDRAIIFEVINTSHPRFIGTAYLPVQFSMPWQIMKPKQPIKNSLTHSLSTEEPKDQ